MIARAGGRRRRRSRVSEGITIAKEIGHSQSFQAARRSARVSEIILI
jgi:hypothetical protein